MTRQRDIGTALERWLVDGVDEMPDRVYLTILDRVERERQRPSWRLHPWRFPAMPTPLKLVLIGAALVAALAAGAVFVGGGGRLMAPAPSPTPTPPALPDGPLSGGTYVGKVREPDPMTWTATIPAGWHASAGWSVNAPERVGSKAVTIAPFLGANVPADSCDSAATVPATSVDEIVKAVQARTDWTVSEPVDVTVGGRPGTRIGFAVPEVLPACAGQDYMVITEGTQNAGGWWPQAQSSRYDLWIVDVEGRPVVLMRTSYADSPAEDVGQSEAIMDSVTITP